MHWKKSEKREKGITSIWDISTSRAPCEKGQSISLSFCILFAIKTTFDCIGCIFNIHIYSLKHLTEFVVLVPRTYLWVLLFPSETRYLVLRNTCIGTERESEGSQDTKLSLTKGSCGSAETLPLMWLSEWQCVRCDNQLIT